ncbi:MAG TPA: hypothetical protein VIS48_03445 [Candidatus Kryptonia bacterium]
MLNKESQWDVVCDSCNGTRFVGVAQSGDGFDFIECEKCHGTGTVTVIQYGFAKEDDDE